MSPGPFVFAANSSKRLFLIRGGLIGFNAIQAGFEDPVDDLAGFLVFGAVGIVCRRPQHVDFVEIVIVGGD